MKKKLLVLTALMMAATLLLTGCSNGKDSGKQKNDISEETDADVSKPVPEALVSDAYSEEAAYTENAYDPQTGQSRDMQVTAVYRIPQINLAGDTAQQINAEVYNTLYPDIQTSVSEIGEYGYPFTSSGITYDWAVNEGVLSLVIANDCNPEASGGTEYFVYNVSVSTGETLMNDQVYSMEGYTQKEYDERIGQVLGSAFFSDKDSYLTNNGYDDFFVEQFQRTISEDNIRAASLYINDAGELCIVARIYSLAAADYYWHDLNVDRSELNPNYEIYMGMAETAADSHSIADGYKAELMRHPASVQNVYGSKEVQIDTEYTLYDIDKDGVHELIIKEDLSQYHVYTFDGTDAVFCGDIFSAYDDCLYAYEGNGLIVYDGGMGSLHLEYVWLYTLTGKTLESTDPIMSTEECSDEDLANYLAGQTPIRAFYPITDYSSLYSM